MLGEQECMKPSTLLSSWAPRCHLEQSEFSVQEETHKYQNKRPVLTIASIEGETEQKSREGLRENTGGETAYCLRWHATSTLRARDWRSQSPLLVSMEKMSLGQKGLEGLLVAPSIHPWVDPASTNRQGRRGSQLSPPRKSLISHPFPEVPGHREGATHLLLQQSLPQRSWDRRGGICIPLLVPVTRCQWE